MKQIAIDINCDVGEGIGNEEVILPLISSCNIATGGHTGTSESMRKVIRLAKTHGVKIGAHPSYPDKENFGRKTLQLSDDALKSAIRIQLKKFQQIIEEEDGIMHHIKAHGALYNDIAKNDALATIFLRSIEIYKDSVYIYVPYNSIIERKALNWGFKIKYEAFGDRNYNPDGSLVSRKEKFALITKPDLVLNHIIVMALEKQVLLLDGKRIPIKADTYCIHGDTPKAYEILQYLSGNLSEYKITIAK